MKVLIACEFSGIVRDAFTKRGHNAWSCDLLPSERPGKHIIGNVLHHLDGNWDLLIAHPPCTFLSVSGARWNRSRMPLQIEAFEFVMRLWLCRIKRKALENPVSVLSSRWRKPDQIIQSWQFGIPESKKTCLWLDGLPPLEPTRIVRWQMNRRPPRLANRVHYASPGPERWKERSRTLPQIAAAMAEQWGGRE